MPNKSQVCSSTPTMITIPKLCCKTSETPQRWTNKTLFPKQQSRTNAHAVPFHFNNENSPQEAQTTEMQSNQTAILILFSFQHSSQQLWLLPLDWVLSSGLFCLHVSVIEFSQVQQQLLQVVSCQRRQGDDPLSYLLPKEWQIDPGLSKVDLIPNHHTGPLRQAFFICFQFVFQVLQLNPGLRHREIHHEQEELAALNVL